MPMRKWQKIQKLSWKKRLIKENAGWGNLSRLCSFYNKEKEGIILENPEIRTLLDEMTQKITSFRRSL